MKLLKALTSAFAFLALFSAALLVPAGLIPDGAWVWPRAWALLAAIGIITTAGSVALAYLRPASFAVRQQGIVADRARRQPLIDAVGAAVYFAFLLGWFVFIPLDVFRFRLLPQPSDAAAALGGVAAIAGLLIGQFAVAQNQFAAPTVQDQTADGQRVIDSGLYGLIRHPLYAGNLLVFGGSALWLQSTAALVAVAGHLGFTLARIAVEETMLRATLPDYGDYARRVRGRLIPYVF